MTYSEYYDNFVQEYEEVPKKGDEVGQAIVVMVQHFSRINHDLAKAESAYNRIIAELAESTDKQTEKPISATKAEMLAKNTAECAVCIGLKKDLSNCEQMINALKCLQRGVMNEYSHLSGT